MKALRVLGFAVMIMLASCQKEISLETGGTPGSGSGSGGVSGSGGGSGSGSTGTMLKKIVTKDPTDSLVENFTYDSQKKLVAYSAKGGTVATDKRDERYTITRDAQGRISQVKEIFTEDNGLTYDTTVTTPHYTSASATTLAYAIVVTNSTDKDSLTYTYASGKIFKQATYIFGGSGYTISDESVYTFDGNNNVTNVKTYDLSSGSTLIFERKYTYDTKTTALNLGMEDGVLIMEYYAGKNNMTKLEIVDYALGLGNITLAYTLAYNSNNMPSTGTLSATIMGIPLPLAITSTHQYQ